MRRSVKRTCFDLSPVHFILGGSQIGPGEGQEEMVTAIYAMRELLETVDPIRRHYGLFKDLEDRAREGGKRLEAPTLDDYRFEENRP